MTNSKYFSEIPADILLGIKHKMKNKIFCSYHLDEKLSLFHGTRRCQICNKISRKKSSQKYLEKKRIESEKKFHF